MTMSSDDVSFRRIARCLLQLASLQPPRRAAFTDGELLDSGGKMGDILELEAPQHELFGQNPSDVSGREMTSEGDVF